MGESHAGSSKTLTNLRVAGAWSGSMEVLLDEWTVKDLRAEVSRRSGFSPTTVNLISAGKVLRDQEQGNTSSPTLREVGFGPNSKLLVTRIGEELANAINQERERSERLSRLKAAADALAMRRSDDYPPNNDYTIQIENQSGEELVLESETDRRALLMGLMLHAKARDLIHRDQFKEALGVLAMAEEAFSLCDLELVEGVDNAALLQLDTVWCHFILRDISRLAVARERLAKAREGLNRSHGTDLERLRVLQGGLCPELAVYVRLELLEGVISYHTGQFEAARQSLTSAYIKFKQLQVSDEAVAQLVPLGFTTEESKRALRFSGQDVQRAAEFAVEERRKRQEKKAKDKKERREFREQRRFGKTPGGKPVDMSKLDQLLSIGYEKLVAAEALRQSENDIQLALDILSNPTSRMALQVALESSAARPPRGQVDSATLGTLLSMGFDRESALQALQSSKSSNQAIEKLLQGQLSQTEVALAAAQDGGATSSRSPSTSQSSDFGGEDKRESRDEEMEEDIATKLSSDPLEQYDLEVQKEGDAIMEYIGLVDSVTVPR